MSRVRPRAATIAGIVLLDAPVAFVLTMMLLPLWSTIERRVGIESVGHSGPASWCFVLVFVCVAALSLGTYLYRLGRPSAADADATR
jgi:4-amino-4-deoxy-L-arabinose transferase-like glycosyltransferase